RELVRIVLEALLGRRDAYTAQHLNRPFARLLRRHWAVPQDDLEDLIPDREGWVERGHRLLEDHRDLVATQLAKLRCRQADEVGSLEPHRAAGHAPWRLGHKTHDAVRHDALATAALADDAKGVPGEERKANAVQGAELTVISGEIRAQLADLEQRRRAVAL